MTSSDVQFQDWLAAVTDTLMADDDADLHALAAEHGIDADDAQPYLEMIGGLRALLVPLDPDPRFVRQLQRELTGSEPGLIARLTPTPTRVRIMAGIMAVMTFLFLAQRRFMGRGERALDTEVSAETAVQS